MKVPENVEGAFLLVRHPQAALLIRRWGRVEGNSESVWTLPEPAQNLTILAKRRDGAVAPGARIAIAIDQLRLSGPVLSWFAASSMANGDGLWQAQALPRATIRLLAWAPNAFLGDLDSTFDALAFAVPHPWPEIVEVEAIE